MERELMEPDLGAEAFADMAMGGMDMSAELNASQIRAFLARNESNSSTKQRQESTPSAYEILKNGAVHYSRREDKMKALQEHPVVATVAEDGRTVGCKCGRQVRLNPPWYILKFEQHVASRNCSFLRQNRPKKRKRVEKKSSQQSQAAEERRDDTQSQEQDSTADSDVDSNEYGLQAVDTILKREFGVTEDGRKVIMPPGKDSPKNRVRTYQGAVALRNNPHFSRITPDGRFIECKCSRIVLLSAPWQPGQFLSHIADKKKPKKRLLTSTMIDGQVKKKRLLGTGVATTLAGLPARNAASGGTVFHAQCSKKSFPREVRWDAARARGLLPCPGLRDERMNTFVASAIQLTGGARPRQKIARELFPHLFSDSTEYAHDDEPDVEQQNKEKALNTRSRLHQQLLEAEKMLLHDEIEGEALWFVDKDGISVRSLDCLGIVDAGKGEERCSSCADLRSNPALRTAATAKNRLATRLGPPPNPVNRKFCSGSVCSLLEAEFDMRELHSRLLRDLALVDIPNDSPLNMWMEMSTMGLTGDFDTHLVLLGLVEAMTRLKDKEQRGVGLQNMSYSEHLDTFMRTLVDLSPNACELFQRHLGGRKHRQLLAATSKALLASKQKPLHSSCGSDGSEDGRSGGHDISATKSTAREDGLALLGPVPNISIGDIQDVDLSSFSTSSGVQHEARNSNDDTPGGDGLTDTEEATVTRAHQKSTDRQTVNDPNSGDIASGDEAVRKATSSNDERNGESGSPEQPSCDTNAIQFLTEPKEPLTTGNKTAESIAVMPSNHVPCTGLRDENVQSYVANAVQLVGGSRPRYVIARELFPRVFGSDKKVRIVDKLNAEQRLVLQDAVFSECLWRVDKEGRCVRSLRCKRFVPVAQKDERTTPQNQGVCRACRDLRTVPNFRSVLSRSKSPKKLENIKYVPSVYTESDPFLRKLSKNSAFRGLYQTVKRLTSAGASGRKEDGAERKKLVCFWLRFARLGVFGHFHSHPVFEGLMKSMVEVKDKERRGVGKQNMQYSRPLDDFMQTMAQISTEAFEVFAAEFCGRTLRSQKVKRKSSEAQALHAASSMTEEVSVGNDQMTEITQSGEHHALLPPVPLPHQHYLIQTEDLLSGRSLSNEESQRFMDRMMAELSASRTMQSEPDEERRSSITGDPSNHEQHMTEDDGSRLGPETYLNDDGVLTTEI